LSILVGTEKGAVRKMHQPDPLLELLISFPTTLIKELYICQEIAIVNQPRIP
jgi:hypothetical protein